MKLASLLLRFIPVLALLWACSESETNDSTKALPPPVVSKKVPVSVVKAFEVPASTRITLEKAKLYADASAALFLLGQQWSDRLEKSSETEKIQITQSYHQAREQLTTKLGLAGMDEFNWLHTKAIADTANRAVFMQVGIKVP